MNYKGVVYIKNCNLYIAQVSYKGKPLFLGLFDESIDAAYAYNQYVIINELNRELNDLPNDFVGKPRRRRECKKNRTWKGHECTSKFVGVTKSYKSAGWIAIGPGRKYIGYFRTEQEAAKAYNDYVSINDVDRPLNEVN